MEALKDKASSEFDSFIQLRSGVYVLKASPVVKERVDAYYATLAKKRAAAKARRSSSFVVRGFCEK